MYKWDAGKALPIIAEENITNFVGVPTQSWDLVNHPDFDKYDTSSLRAVGGGGVVAGGLRYFEIHLALLQTRLHGGGHHLAGHFAGGC